MLRSKASPECSSRLAPLGNISGILRGKGKSLSAPAVRRKRQARESGCLPFASASLRSKLIVTMLMQCNLIIISRNRPRSKGAALRGVLGIVALPHMYDDMLPDFQPRHATLGLLLGTDAARKAVNSPLLSHSH